MAMIKTISISDFILKIIVYREEIDFKTRLGTFWAN